MTERKINLEEYKTYVRIAAKACDELIKDKTIKLSVVQLNVVFQQILALLINERLIGSIVTDMINYKEVEEIERNNPDTRRPETDTNSQRND